MKLTAEQHRVLLMDLSPDRVANRSQAGRKLSYIESWDARRTLIRIFGFGGWDGEVLSADLIYQSERPGKNNSGTVYDVGYRVHYRLTVRGLDSDNGYDFARYSEVSVGTASGQPDCGEAHDLALKSAESDAMKRCAMNLGTQFGLSLYDDGSTGDVVRRTLIGPEGAPQPPRKADPAKPVSAEITRKLTHAVGHREVTEVNLPGSDIVSEAAETMMGTEDYGPDPSIVTEVTR